jgi:hypothetical protein
MKQIQIGSFFALNNETMDRLSYIAEKLECSQLEALDKSIEFNEILIKDLTIGCTITIKTPEGVEYEYKVVDDNEEEE